MAKKKKLDEEKEVVGSGPEETEEKATGALSEGVLDAFEDESPTGLEDEEKISDDEEDDELAEMDFMTSDNW